MSYYQPGSQGLLKPIDPWLQDEKVSEILLNRPQEIWVEKNNQLTFHKIPEWTTRQLHRLFQLIANENQQTLSASTPTLSGSLPDGSRVQLCLPPVSKYHTLSIRRKVIKNFSLDYYQKNNFYSEARISSIEDHSLSHLPETEKTLVKLYQKNDWNVFIKKAIEFKKNIIISGGTSSGKTTFLNACLQHIPMHERLILLEDTREVETPHQNQVQLLAAKGEQGEAKVSMQDLVQCSLRLRPDRIIMGEVRGKEIMDFVSSCSTGHEGAFTSIHANNPRIAFMRMTQMYKLNQVPAMTDEDILRELKEVVDIIIQLAKTPRGRKVQEVYYRYGYFEKKVGKNV